MMIKMMMMDDDDEVVVGIGNSQILVDDPCSDPYIYT